MQDQVEGGELDSHEEVRLPFVGAGEIKSREWSWAQKVGLLLLQSFLNSCATDIVLVTAPHGS